MIFPQESFRRRLIPLALTQFLGIFNDHAFKIIAVLAAVSLSDGYSSDAAFLALLTVIFVLPYLIFSEFAGFLADRCPKRNIMLLAKLAEICVMLLGVVVLSKINSWGVYPLVGVMFLMASQSAFFSPSFNGIIPELFSEKELSSANGNIGMLNFMAVITGVACGFILKGLVKDNLYVCGFLFSLFSLFGFLSALKIPARPSANKARRWHWNLILKYADGLKTLFRKRSLFVAMLGESYFFAAGTAVQSLLVVYAKYNLDIPGESSFSFGIIQLALAVGMGLGCWLSGKLSTGKVELGLVPFGAAGMVIFFFLVVIFPGDAFAIKSVIIYPVELVMLFLLGISGGIFVIPLRSYQQNYTDPAERGNFFANANMICFSAIMLAGLLMFLFTTGSDPGTAKNMFERGLFALQQHCFDVDPAIIMMSLGVFTFVTAAMMFIFVPEYSVRCFILILTNTLYKLKVTGVENIPEKGPALLVANHVSFVDGLLISSCTSRPVHFLMHEDFYRLPLLRPFVKWAGIIEVPARGRVHGTVKMFDEARKYLRRGEIVCVFPEGRITRNGIMNNFRKGLSRMVPEGIDVPVIPIRMGMIWGSIFSYYYGKVKFRMPMEFPHPASVTIGKPVSADIEPFDLRQKISLLAAETEMEPRPKERTIHYRFAVQAKRHPFRVAVKDFDGKSLKNYELFIRAALLSREIKKIVPENKKYTGIMLPNTGISAVTILGTLFADKVPAMINFTASEKSIASAIRKAGINCILTSRGFLKKANIPERPDMVFLEDIAGRISESSKRLAFLAFFLFPRQELMNFLAPRTHRNVYDTAVLLFSSGSTGDPKGVMLSHHNINSDVHSCLRIMGWTKKDSILGNLPLFHSFGITTAFWLPLMTGTKVVYISNPLDAEGVGRAVRENKITVLLATPTFLQAYMRKCSPERMRSLRLVITGAEKLRDDIARKFKRLYGLEVIEGYGATELSPIVAINVSGSILDLGKRPGRKGSIGPPMPGICVKITDPETGRELPPGWEGLMCVKGPNVMQGYLEDRKKTAEVLIDGWYNTGDIARMDTDGYLTITGRLSRFSKIAGEMVPHELVEKSIFEILRSENRCIAVCGVPDKSKGEKLVVLHTKLKISVVEIIEKLRKKKLPGLWIPRQRDFYEVKELPLLGSGKLDLVKAQEKAMEVAGATSLCYQYRDRNGKQHSEK